MTDQDRSPSWGLSDYSRLAWELARRARFDYDHERPAKPIRATVNTVAGDIKGWGRTYTEALQHLAEGLDLWEKEMQVQAMSESVALGPTIIGGQTSPVPQQPLGKDATCSYCGGALWVCRGTHNIC